LAATASGEPSPDRNSLGVANLLRELGALTLGFAGYYTSIGDVPAIWHTLSTLDAELDQRAARALPPAVLAHPLWLARPRLAGRSMLPRLLGPVGYASELDREAAVDRGTATAVNEAPALEPSETAADEARASLIDDRLVVLRSNTYLTLRQGHVELRTRKRTFLREPLERVRSVLLHGHGNAVSSALMLALAARDVPVLIAVPASTDIALVTASDSGRPSIRTVQARRADDSAVVRMGLDMLEAKVSNQASLLRYYAKYRRRRGEALAARLDEVAGEIRQEAQSIAALPTDDRQAVRARAMGHEGRAAALYWSAIAGLLPAELAFTGRVTRGAEDPVNQSLNYLYGCLYGEVWRALAQFGLDPSIGILHGTDRRGAFLVYDLIEEFRARFVDRVVFSLLGRGFRPKLSRDSLLQSRSRRLLVRAFFASARRRVAWCGERVPLATLLARRASAIVAVFRESAASAPAFHLRW
jgi:CRISPR-associated protein Cas1